MQHPNIPVVFGGLLLALLCLAAGGIAQDQNMEPPLQVDNNLLFSEFILFDANHVVADGNELNLQNAEFEILPSQQTSVFVEFRQQNQPTVQNDSLQYRVVARLEIQTELLAPSDRNAEVFVYMDKQNSWVSNPDCILLRLSGGQALYQCFLSPTIELNDSFQQGLRLNLLITSPVQRRIRIDSARIAMLVSNSPLLSNSDEWFGESVQPIVFDENIFTDLNANGPAIIDTNVSSTGPDWNREHTDVDSDSEAPIIRELFIPAEQKTGIKELVFQLLEEGRNGISTSDFELEISKKSTACEGNHCSTEIQIKNKTSQQYCFSASDLFADAPELANSETSGPQKIVVVRSVLEKKIVTKKCVEGTIDQNSCFVRGQNILNESFPRKVNCQTLDNQNNCTLTVNKKVSETITEETVEKTNFAETCVAPLESGAFKVAFQATGQRGNYSLRFGPYALEAHWFSREAMESPASFEPLNETEKIDKLAEGIIRLKNIHQNKRFFNAKKDRELFPALAALNGIEVALECNPANGPQLDENKARKKNKPPMALRKNKSKNELKEEFQTGFFGNQWESNAKKPQWEQTENRLECDGVELTNSFRSDAPNETSNRIVSLGGSKTRVKQTISLQNKTNENQTRLVNIRLLTMANQVRMDTETVSPASEYQSVPTRYQSFELEQGSVSAFQNASIQLLDDTGNKTGFFDWSDIVEKGFDTETVFHRQNNQTVIETTIRIFLNPLETIELDPAYDLNATDNNGFDIRWNGFANSAQTGYTYQSRGGIHVVNADNGSYANDLLINSPDHNTNAGAVYFIKNIDANQEMRGPFSLANASSYTAQWRGGTGSDAVGRSGEYYGIQLVDLDNNGYTNDLIMGAYLTNTQSRNDNGAIYIIKDIDKKNGNFWLGATSSFAVRFDGAAASDNLGRIMGATGTTRSWAGAPGIMATDLDGNGYANDLLLVASVANVGATDRGGIYLVLDADKKSGAIDFGTASNYNAVIAGGGNSDSLALVNNGDQGGFLLFNADNGATADDLVVQAYLARINGISANGAVYYVQNISTRSGDVNLGNSANYNARWSGSTANDQVGTSSRSGDPFIVADTQNDGKQNDLLISANGMDIAGAVNAGAVFYMRDINSFSGDFNLAVPSSYSIRWIGTTASDLVGYTNTSGPNMILTDIDGNGYANDLILPVPYFGGSNTGTVFIMKDIDKKTTASYNLSDSNSYDIAVNGGTTNDLIGDNNQSGFAIQLVNVDNGTRANDLIVNAPLADVNSKTNNGAVYLIQNIDINAGTINLASSYSVRWAGSQSSDFLGSNFSDYNGAQIVNIDNGSYANDLLITASLADGPATNNGAVYLIRNIDSISNRNQDLNTAANFSVRWRGAKLNDFLGQTNSGTGLFVINSDGGDYANDIVIAAPYADVNGKTDNGAVYLAKNADGLNGTYDFNSNQFDIMWNGGTSSDFLGYMNRGGNGIQPANLDNGSYSNDLLLGAYLADTNGNTNNGAVYAMLNYDQNNLPPNPIGSSLDANRTTAEHRPKILVSFSAYLDQCNYTYYENNAIRGYGSGIAKGTTCQLQTFFLRPGTTAFWDVNGTNAYGTGTTYRTKSFTYQTYWDSNADYNVSINVFDYNFSRERSDQNISLNGEMDWNNASAGQIIGDQNLVLWTDFEDQNATNYMELTRNKNDPVITGSVQTGNIGILGGKAIGNFSSSNYADMNSLHARYPTVWDNNFTISLWVNPSSLSSSQQFFGYIGVGANNRLYLGAGITANKFSFLITDSASVSTGQVDSTNSFTTTNQWYHVSITKENNAKTLYVNGKSEATNSTALGTVQLAGLRAGYIGGLGGQFTGTMDDVRVYDRALSATDVNALYNEGIIDQNLVGYWKFNESDYNGTFVQDYSTNNKDGFLVNGADINASGLFDSNAGYFDGTNDYVQLPAPTANDALDLDWNYTICAWIKPKTGAMGIIKRGADAPDDFSHQYAFHVNGNGGLMFEVNDSEGGVDKVSSANSIITANNWYYVCAVVDSITMRVYKNGVDVSSPTTTKNVTWMGTETVQLIGGTSTTQDLFTGYIDEVKIWNKALTAVQILADYNQWWNAHYYSKILNSNSAGYSSGDWNSIDLDADINAATNRVRFQVRSCDDSACSGENFIGPNGTNSTHYDYNGNNPVFLSNVSDNRFFQYKLFLDFNNASSNNFSSWPKASRMDVNFSQAVSAPTNNPPDVNITKIDGNLDTGSFGIFNYYTDGNLTIDFNVQDPDTNSLLATLSYITIDDLSAGIAGDINLSMLGTIGAYKCDDTNFQNSTQCSLDWNISSTSDNNYFVQIIVLDGDNNATDTSDKNFRIVNNRQPDLNVIKPEIAGDAASTDYNVVWRADDNDTSDTLKTACYADTDQSGYTQTYTCFTNVDTNKAQTNSRICDLSSWNAGNYYIWCSLDDQRQSNNSIVYDYSQGFITQSIVSLVIKDADLNLGTLFVQDSNTSESDANGFWLENNGNVDEDVKISATQLFIQASGTSGYFRFKTSDVESGALGAGSLLTYTNMPLDTNLTFAYGVDYADISDEFRVDLNVFVPSDEPSGLKTTEITFLAVQACPGC